MLRRSRNLGEVAHAIYNIFNVLIIASLIILLFLWGKANLVGMIIVACIALLPVLILWHKNRHKMCR